MKAGNLINFKRRPDLRILGPAMIGNVLNPVGYHAGTAGAARSWQRAPMREASRC